MIAGCLYKELNDPGNLQFDWLEVQLNMYRKRGTQAQFSMHDFPCEFQVRCRLIFFLPQLWMSGGLNSTADHFDC